MRILKAVPALFIAVALVAAPVVRAEDAAQKADAPAGQIEKSSAAKAEAKTADAVGTPKKECEHCKKGHKCKDCKKDGKICKKCKEMNKEHCKHCDRDKHVKESKDQVGKEKDAKEDEKK